MKYFCAAMIYAVSMSCMMVDKFHAAYGLATISLLLVLI